MQHFLVLWYNNHMVLTDKQKKPDRL